MPTKWSTPKMMHRAAELRSKPTEAEARLWAHLRAHRLAGIGFRRQHAIGPYIVDFYAPRAKLIIEVDGSQHLDRQEYDSERTQFLLERGYKVLRFWNNEVMDQIKSVLDNIYNALQE